MARTTLGWRQKRDTVLLRHCWASASKTESNRRQARLLRVFNDLGLPVTLSHGSGQEHLLPILPEDSHDECCSLFSRILTSGVWFRESTWVMGGLMADHSMDHQLELAKPRDELPWSANHAAFQLQKHENDPEVFLGTSAHYTEKLKRLHTWQRQVCEPRPREPGNSLYCWHLALACEQVPILS